MADFRRWLYALALVALLAGLTVPASSQIVVLQQSFDRGTVYADCWPSAIWPSRMFPGNAAKLVPGLPVKPVPKRVAFIPGSEVVRDDTPLHLALQGKVRGGPRLPLPPDNRS